MLHARYSMLLINGLGWKPILEILKTMSRASISVSMDSDNPEDCLTRELFERLAVKYNSSLSAVARSAFAIVADNPKLIESRVELNTRQAGRKLVPISR